MDATTCLSHFLERAVVAGRRDRLAGFAGKTSTRAKFLECLDHALVSAIDETFVVASLLPTDWQDTAFLFSSEGTFGAPVATLREGYEKAPAYGGWLLVSGSGRAAILRPEGRIDDERLFRI